MEELFSYRMLEMYAGVSKGSLLSIQMLSFQDIFQGSQINLPQVKWAHHSGKGFILLWEYVQFLFVQGQVALYVYIHVEKAGAWQKT